ncbi:MBL fold metallo-hydrolase [Shewanella sp. AS1]|uniref:MBL fold metallo-hydrolase n=1 Tax=Shewanella sp. AS1 TaxID=2907626 RepID=UPI001F19A18B|nr:MBL fold metallo-hydrolase [Shewanella sp. AS1]MCE9679865.1 MBL fold metallo-hydrolase [Shewanella sp. AS1]
MQGRQFLKECTVLGTSLPLIHLAQAEPFTSEINNGISPENPNFTPDLQQIRKLAHAVPGELPQRINIVKIANTFRNEDLVMQGGDLNKKVTLARAAHQLVYPNGSIMIDSGMDAVTHDFFGAKTDPFYQDQFERLNQALLQANLIVLSHYHADHVAGVVRSNHFDQIAHKVLLASDTADLMVNQPHKASVAITQKKVDRFIQADFARYYPIAPGIVAIKAPGHTPDSKMFYIKLQNGQEFLHSVDTGWTMDNIRQQKMKSAPWVKEDQQALQAQYHWINQLERDQANIIQFNSHDTPNYLMLKHQGHFGDLEI